MRLGPTGISGYLTSCLCIGKYHRHPWVSCRSRGYTGTKCRDHYPFWKHGGRAVHRKLLKIMLLITWSLNYTNYIKWLSWQLHMWGKRRKKQKMWYDRNAKLRSFKSVQKVLIMLPTSENKLLGKWFEVTKKLGTTTYPRTDAFAYRVLHINLLKEWYPQT